MAAGVLAALLLGAFFFAVARFGVEYGLVILLVAVLAGAATSGYLNRTNTRHLQSLHNRLEASTFRLTRAVNALGQAQRQAARQQVAQAPAPVDVGEQVADALRTAEENLDARLAEEIDQRIAWPMHLERRRVRQLRREVTALRLALGELAPPAASEEEVAAEVVRIGASSLFDPEWYLAQLPTPTSIEPVEHYVRLGAPAGLTPHPLFDPGWYRSQHPAARWVTPLGHYLAVDGSGLPHPLLWPDRLDPSRLATGPAGAGTLLERYLATDPRVAGDPNPLFDVAWYFEQHGHLIEDGQHPLVHFVTVGHRLGCDPSPLVDVDDLHRRFGEGDGTDPLSTFLALHATGGLEPLRRTLSTSSSRRLGRPRREADVKWQQLLEGAFLEEDSFVLYRIIGNDLPPRHREGQGLANLRFILDHEPDLPGCEKRFVVNRIIDPDVDVAVRRLLDEHGYEYLHLPFDAEEYRQIGWCTEDIRPGFTYSDEFAGLAESTQMRVIDHLYHDKNLYVMNNNGARNGALREGRERARWILPWDGNCFVTAEAWEEIVTAVTRRSYFRYAVVPMARITDNHRLLDADFRPGADEEPQIVFRNDAAEEFDERMRYGRRPKVELLQRLGVPGPWDEWVHEEWDDEPLPPAAEMGQFHVAGWVARLYSGQAQQETDSRDRGLRRIEGIRACIDDLDAMLARERFDRTEPMAVRLDVLEAQREQWRAGVASLTPVIEELLAGADRLLAGEGTRANEPPSAGPEPVLEPAYYHAMAIAAEAHTLALAAWFTEDGRYAKQGAELLRTWFVDDDTRLSPGWRQPEPVPGIEVVAEDTGPYAMRDLYLVLDAARLYDRVGVWDGSLEAGLTGWLVDYVDWLEVSDAGRTELARPDHRATWAEVQLVAAHAYLDDVLPVLNAYRRVDERLRHQFLPDGRQPHELPNPDAQHACTLNLQGWVTLAAMGERIGVDLWQRSFSDRRSLEMGLRWLLDQMEGPWPYPEAAGFDQRRLDVLVHHWPGASSVARASRPGTPAELPCVLPSVCGITPYWQLGRPG